MTPYVYLFVGQFLAFLIVVINNRASVKGWIKMTVATDFVFLYVNALMIQKISAVDPNNQLALFVYALGGCLGSAVAIYITPKMNAQ